MPQSESPPPQQPPPPPPSRLSRLLRPSRSALSGRPRAAWIGGGVALLLIVLGITAAVASPGGHGSSGSPSAAGTDGRSGSDATTGTPGAATPGADGAATEPGARSTPRDTAPASPAPLTHPSTRLAPASARDAAAAELLADDTHYRQQLAAGERLLGHPGFAGWAADTLTDTTGRTDATRAAADFTVSDRPPALIPWGADNGQAVSAVRQFAHDGPDGASIATRTDAVNALADLTAADQLARQVRAGD